MHWTLQYEHKYMLSTSCETQATLVVLGPVLLVSLAAVVQRRLCPTFHKWRDRTAQRVLASGLRQEQRVPALR
jgi:hypothetical protein